MIDFLIRMFFAAWFFPFLTAEEDSGMTYLVDLVGRYLAAACDTVFHFASSTHASIRFMAIPTLVRHSFGRVLDLSPIPPCTAAVSPRLKRFRLQTLDYGARGKYMQHYSADQRNVGSTELAS